MQINAIILPRNVMQNSTTLNSGNATTPCTSNVTTEHDNNKKRKSDHFNSDHSNNIKMETSINASSYPTEQHVLLIIQWLKRFSSPDTIKKNANRIMPIVCKKNTGLDLCLRSISEVHAGANKCTAVIGPLVMESLNNYRLVRTEKRMKIFYKMNFSGQQGDQEQDGWIIERVHISLHMAMPAVAYSLSTNLHSKIREMYGTPQQMDMVSAVHEYTVHEYTLIPLQLFQNGTNPSSLSSHLIADKREEKTDSS